MNKDLEILNQKVLTTLSDIQVYGIWSVITFLSSWVLWILALGTDDSIGFHDTSNLLIWAGCWISWTIAFVRSNFAKKIRDTLAK